MTDKETKKKGKGDKKKYIVPALIAYGTLMPLTVSAPVAMSPL